MKIVLLIFVIAGCKTLIRNKNQCLKRSPCLRFIYRSLTDNKKAHFGVNRKVHNFI